MIHSWDGSNGASTATSLWPESTWPSNFFFFTPASAPSAELVWQSVSLPAGPARQLALAAMAACQLSRSAVKGHHASPVDRHTRQPSRHPSSHRLPKCVHTCRDLYATYLIDTRSDPGPCQCLAILHG